MKLLLLLLTIVSFFTFNANAVDYDETESLSENFYMNLNTESLAGFDNSDPDGNAKIEDGFKTQIYKWVKNISTILGLFAVGAIVYGGFMMTVSLGEDEKLKKAKYIIKWGILGFLALISAGAIITIVINLIYGLGG